MIKSYILNQLFYCSNVPMRHAHIEFEFECEY